MKDLAPAFVGVSYLASICFVCWLVESGWPLVLVLVLCVDDVMAAARG